MHSGLDPRASRTGVGGRRAPIPRPWLTEHHYRHPPPGVYPLHHDYRYAAPPLGAPYGRHSLVTPDASMELLRKPEWKVSWNKLSCCFCNKVERDASTNKNSQDVHRRRNHTDAPFPAFPILRRNSSSSLMVNENDIYASGGSVSSFTESDTSYSDSRQEQEVQRRNDTFDSEDFRRPESPPRATTPPPEPVMEKPRVVKSRSHSAGVAAIRHPIIQQTSPNNNVPMRQRIDTDFSRHSGTTNTSRHRRRVQYQFSDRSMEKIWQGKAIDEKLILPSYVLCQSQSSNDEGSGYVSALDDSETGWGTSSDNYDGDNDEHNFGAHFAQMQQLQKDAANEKSKRRRDPARPPKASSARRRESKANLPPKRPAKRASEITIPTYLPKNASLDAKMKGNVVVSGWVAASVGSSSTLEDRLRVESRKQILGVGDILYMHLVDVEDGSRVILQKSNGDIAHEVVLQRDWMCESRDISSRVGRCVTIKSRSSQKAVACLLPVSLESVFFSGNELVSAQQFGKIHEQMFVSGNGHGAYAPVEQHDAAMYIMFSLDALIKNSP